MDLPVIEGVRYIVSWQDHRNAPIPPLLTARDDVRVFRFNDKGLSRNRNNALAHCSGDVILISDDDTKFYPDGISSLIESFMAYPDMDVATLRADYPTHRKSYPPAYSNLHIPLPKNYCVASIEIALRRITGGALKFHPDFGLGSSLLHGGEDEILLLTAINRGLVCRHLPIVVCAHPTLSTGYKPELSSKNIRAMGCVIALSYPLSSVLRIPLKAWRIHKSHQSSFFKSLRYLISGALRAPLLFPDKEYLWK